jgi:8-oxo-dGTP diphosphatase
VIGLVARGDEFLMIRRADGVAKPGTWCFPGGHVEAGETPRRAVQRELLEELGIVVQPTQRLGAIRVLDSRHILAVWRVHHVSGEFRIARHEIADMRWVALQDIRCIQPGLPSNGRVLEMLTAIC